jgi:hypothetical protein
MFGGPTPAVLLRERRFGSGRGGKPCWPGPKRRRILRLTGKATPRPCGRTRKALQAQPPIWPNGNKWFPAEAMVRGSARGPVLRFCCRLARFLVARAQRWAEAPARLKALFHAASAGPRPAGLDGPSVADFPKMRPHESTRRPVSGPGCGRCHCLGRVRLPWPAESAQGRSGGVGTAAS